MTRKVQTETIKKVIELKKGREMRRKEEWRHFYVKIEIRINWNITDSVGKSELQTYFW